MRYIDLFAGAGGLSEGFVQTGFEPIAHVESDTAACNTLLTRTAYYYLKNQGELETYSNYISNTGISRDALFNQLPNHLKESVINLQIGQEKNEAIFQQIDRINQGKKVDLIIGGPPCQAYSLVGRSRDKNRMQGDSRNYLYLEYIKFLQRYQPEYFVFENVIGLLSAKSKDGTLYLDLMLQGFKEAGYSTELKQLNASDYGVLQNRKRIILIGKKGNHQGFYPEIKKSETQYCVADVLKDLIPLKPGEGAMYAAPYKSKSTDYLDHPQTRFRNC